MKTIGATGRTVSLHFLLLVLILGAAGIFLGILAGAVVQGGLAGMLAGVLPERLALRVAWAGVGEAILLGFAVVALFSFLPLYRLRRMRPAAIFHQLPPPAMDRGPAVLSGMLILVFFTALVLWHMRDIRFGIYFVGAVAVMILLSGLLAQLLLWMIRRLPVRHLALRQAIRGLFRRGNATRAIMIALTVSLAVIFGDHLIEKNLNKNFVQSFPMDAPNAFVVDIQPNQTDAFAAAGWVNP